MLCPLNHQDRIRLDNALTAAADDPEVIAPPRALIDRIWLVSNHAVRWNVARTAVNTYKAAPELSFRP